MLLSQVLWRSIGGPPVMQAAGRSALSVPSERLWDSLPYRPQWRAHSTVFFGADQAGGPGATQVGTSSSSGRRHCFLSSPVWSCRVPREWASDQSLSW